MKASEIEALREPRGIKYSRGRGIEYTAVRRTLTPALSHPLRRRDSAASPMGEGEPRPR